MKKLIVLLLIITVFEARAQTNHIMFRTGYGTFNMATQRKFQSNFSRNVQFPVTMKVVDKFPPYWIYGGSFSIRPVKEFRLAIGLMFEMGSTGGRLDYQDYSGSARLDQVLTYKQFGMTWHIQLNNSEKWMVLANLGFSAVKTKETIEFTIAIDQQKQSESEKFQSTNFGFRPGFSVQRKLGVFLFDGTLAYEIQPAATMENSESRLAFRSPDGDMNAKWGGLRAQVGVGIVLQKRVSDME